MSLKPGSLVRKRPNFCLVEASCFNLSASLNSLFVRVLLRLTGLVPLLLGVVTRVLMLSLFRFFALLCFLECTFLQFLIKKMPFLRTMDFSNLDNKYPWSGCMPCLEPPSLPAMWVGSALCEVSCLSDEKEGNERREEEEENDDDRVLWSFLPSGSLQMFRYIMN